MKAMRLVTTICWIITALLLSGLAVWFLTGTVFGFRSDKWGSGWFSGLGIGNWEALSGPYEVVGTYKPEITGINSLNVDWVAGDVTVKPYDGNDLQITEFAQRELKDNEKLFISTSGGTLTIKFRESNMSVRMPQKKLEVLIPQALSESLNRLSAESVSGAVFIDSINVDMLKTGSTSGAIQISDSSSQTLEMDSTSGSLTIESSLSETMKLKSTSSAIRISDSTTKTLDCDTTSGSINVSGTFDSAKLNSISGRISIDSVASNSTIEADSTSGSLDLSGSFKMVDVETMSGSISITSKIVPSELKADTTSGGITVTVPNRGEITVNHSSISGRFSSDIPVIMQSRNAQFNFSSVSGSTRILAQG